MEAFDLYTSILTDHQSGSSGILRNTVDWICESLSAGADPEEIRVALDAICKKHSTMALLQNFRQSLQFGAITTSAVRDWMQTYREHEHSACKHFSEWLAEQKVVLVYSNSGMLETSLLMVPRTLHVYCAESRPGLEGVLLAKKLSQSQHRITLLTDMAAFSIIPKIDVLAFGCDAITSEGIVNKLGTYPLAAASRGAGKQNGFVGTSEKKSDFWKQEYLNHQGLREEIYTGTDRIEVENFYFDLTPFELVNNFFLETGLQQRI